MDATHPFVQRIGIIGDVHGEAKALSAVLDGFQNCGPLDAILCTGDLPARQGTSDLVRCCKLLTDVAVWTVRGNHDRWYLDDLQESRGEDERATMPEAYLRSLPATRTFQTPLGPLLLCHGCGANDMAGIYPGGDDEPIVQALQRYQVLGRYSILIAGHTHQRMIRPVDSVLCINPGTLLLDERPGSLILDLEQKQLQWFDLEPETSTMRCVEPVAFPVWYGSEVSRVSS